MILQLLLITDDCDTLLLSLHWCVNINLLKPSGNFTYHQVQHSKILCGAHIVFMCFVWISEQTATFCLSDIKRLVFITKRDSVYSAVCTESLHNADTLCLQRVNYAVPTSQIIKV
jgi:hypothetical protein